MADDLFTDASRGLGSINGGARTQNLMQVRASGAGGSGSNFTGTITFPFEISGATKWLPNESYLTMRMKLVKKTQGSGDTIPGAGSRPIQSVSVGAGSYYGDKLALINNPCPYCFSRISFRVQSSTMDDCTFVGPTDTALYLANTTKNYRDTIGKNSGWGTFQERQNAISYNGADELTANAAEPEFVWTPTLGIFSTPHAVAGGLFTLELQVDSTWKQVIVETLRGARGPGNVDTDDDADNLVAGTDYDITLTDISFWLQTVEQTIPKGITEQVLDYRGVLSQTFQISGSSANHFSVGAPPSIIKIIELFRPTTADLKTRVSASNFTFAQLLTLRNTIPAISWTRPNPDLELDVDLRKYGKAYSDWCQCNVQDDGASGGMSLDEWAGTGEPYTVSGTTLIGSTADISPPSWPMFGYRVVRPPDVPVSQLSAFTYHHAPVDAIFLAVMVYSAACKITLNPHTGQATAAIIDQSA